ncbi:hypothetical protein MMIN_32580 [Mycolicibacter minnesotensis]|nr:hypothetical protein MMIN_32580 [Mycolicibacter minnesotensis]
MHVPMAVHGPVLVGVLMLVLEVGVLVSVVHVVVRQLAMGVLMYVRGIVGVFLVVDMVRHG